MRWERSVLPCSFRCDFLARANRMPGCAPEVGMLDGLVGAFKNLRSNVGLWKIRDRIATRFEEYEHLLAIGDPGTAKAGAHAPTQRLDIQQSLGQRFGNEETADRSRRERTLF